MPVVAKASPACVSTEPVPEPVLGEAVAMREVSAGQPDFAAVLALAQHYRIVQERFEAHACRRWGVGWKLNPRPDIDPRTQSSFSSAGRAQKRGQIHLSPTPLQSL